MEVRVAPGLSVGELKRSATQAFGEILGHSLPTELLVAEIKSRVTQPVPDDWRIEGGQVLVARVGAGEDRVSITTILVLSGPGVPATEAGLWAEVDACSTRSKLEVALCVALAIGIASLSGSHVLDDELLWSDVYDQGPLELTERLKVREHGATLIEALSSLWDSLPISKI